MKGFGKFVENFLKWFISFFGKKKVSREVFFDSFFWKGIHSMVNLDKFLDPEISLREGILFSSRKALKRNPMVCKNQKRLIRFKKFVKIFADKWASLTPFFVSTKPGLFYFNEREKKFIHWKLQEFLKISWEKFQSSFFLHVFLAQWIEQQPSKLWVTGSSPVGYVSFFSQKEKIFEKRLSLSKSSSFRV